MEKLEPGAPGRKVTVVKYPTPSDTPPASAKESQAEQITELDDDDESEEEQNKPKIPQHILNDVIPRAPEASKTYDWNDIWDKFQAEHKRHNVRSDWYESDTSVNVSLFVKNLPADKVKVDSEKQSVSLCYFKRSCVQFLTLV
ncbi:hypothetical protein I5L01_15215 [Erythrobacter sp. YJ-T3-07]|nr:hypothetical protein [Erythrobacter sp. YJ-T3-07]